MNNHCESDRKRATYSSHWTDFNCPIMGNDLDKTARNNNGENVARLLDLKAEKYLKLLCPYLVLIGFGSLTSYAFHDGSTLWRGFGEACVIAGLLGIVIELYSAKQLISHVSDELAGKLVGRGLPDKLQQQVGDIVKTRVVRENWVKAYSFADPQNNEMIITVNITYVVRNYGERPEKYSPHLAEEPIYSPRFLFLEYKSDDGKGFHFNEESLAGLVKPECAGQSISVDGPHEIILEPIKYNKKSCCEVSWRYQVTMPHIYSDIMSFGGPTIGVKVRIDHCPSGYEVAAVGKGVHHLPGSSIWDFDASFLESQHIRVRWFVKAQPSSAMTSSSNHT